MFNYAKRYAASKALGIPNYVAELTMAPSCTILAARSATILAFLRALHCRTLHTARAAADVDATATKAERARGVDISNAGTN